MGREREAAGRVEIEGFGLVIVFGKVPESVVVTPFTAAQHGGGTGGVSTQAGRGWVQARCLWASLPESAAQLAVTFGVGCDLNKPTRFTPILTSEVKACKRG